MSALTASIDAALRKVARAEERGLVTKNGEPAAPHLAALREQLLHARDAAATTGEVDAKAIGAMVRDVAAWYPEDKVHLIAALGAIVQAGRQ